MVPQKPNQNREANSGEILVGIDTGGTFTDIVLLSGGKIRQCKVLSTPQDPSEAIFEGLDRLGLADQDIRIIHGTTVGTNAVLEGKGARVAYITSQGFADVLTLGRQNREQVYSLRQCAVKPPVEREYCLEVSTRIAADGNILVTASDDELTSLKHQLEALEAESVAINLLFSFLHPEQEKRIADALGSGWFVSLSSEVLPELREFERGIATWLDASVGPVLSRYLARLAERIPKASISVMQSSGTTIAASQAAKQAVRLLLSGPAGGLSAALLAGRVTGQSRLLTFDMGGTSTDVSLLDGEIPISSENRIGDWPLSISSVDIHTIGAGGGSIARVDRGGMLLVGPESAGASPGPACYGQGGTEVTVSDANLVLGRIPKNTLLGGYLPLDFEAAANAMDDLARELQCSRLEAARGVITLANEHMARALRVMSVERGHDPREYALFCFGGAGGLHACELANLLEVPCVLLPARAGVLSAQGMLASEPGRDLSSAVLKDISVLNDEALQEYFDSLKADATGQLEQENVDISTLKFRQRMELRYKGQSSGFLIDFVGGGNHAEKFHKAHLAASGHCLELEIELVNVRLAARVTAAMTRLEETTPPAVLVEAQMIYMADMKSLIAVYDRDSMLPGESLEGPAIISEAGSTVWLAPGWTARPDRWGNLVLEVA
ncbi:MAG: N-methylhydantoinase A [Lysobacterales bacterium]|jgi:N-methylhydantoinase A